MSRTKMPEFINKIMKQAIALFLAIAMVATSFVLDGVSVLAAEDNGVKSQSSNTVSLSVDSKVQTEVALAVGDTAVNYADFENELKEALIAEGMKEDTIDEQVTFQKVDASAVASQDTFSWWTYDHRNGSTSHDDTNHAYYDTNASYSSSAENNYDNPDYVYNHIVESSGGSTMEMYGYGVKGYKDFKYMPNTQSTKKTIEFTISEGNAYDALDGVGFFVNTSITGSYTNQLINGYLVFFQYNGKGYGASIKIFELNEVNAYSLHHTQQTTFDSLSSVGNNTSVFGGTVTLKAINTVYDTTGTKNYKRKVKIEVMPDYVKVWYGGNASSLDNITLTESSAVKWSDSTYKDANGISDQTKFQLTQGYDGTGSSKTYRGGYGPIAAYRSHGCSSLTKMTLSNLKMEAEYVKSLTQTIRGPEWNEDKQSFLVNLNEQSIADFSDVYTSSEIINRLADEDVTYIGWCSGDNYTDSMKFVEGVGNNSALISTDGQTTLENADAITSGYTAAARRTQIRAIAKAIVNKINSKKITVSENTYLDTDNFQFSVLGTTLSDGKWSVGYATNGYEAAKNSVTKYNNLESASFTDVGYYEIYYDEDYDNPKAKIRIHQAPVANFAVAVSSDTATKGMLNVTNKSYDPEFIEDSQISQADGSAAYGIVTNKIEYRNMTAQTDWTETAPTAAEVAGKVWMIRLTVADEYGVTNSLVRQITADSESGGVTTPTISLYNSFGLSSTQLKHGIADVDATISIIDKSYASDGSKNFKSYYTITQNSTKKVCTNNNGVLSVSSSTTGYTTSTSPEAITALNIQNLPVGTYTVSMYAQTTSGTTVKTETVSRNFTITQAYAVQYNLNSGTGELPTQYKYNGATLMLSMTQPTREGYTFAGWSASSAANLELKDVNYHPGDTYSANAGLNLYAVWLKNKIFAGSLTVNYKMNYTYSGTGDKEYTGLVEQQFQDGKIVLRRTVIYTNNTKTVTDYDACSFGEGALQPVTTTEDVNGDGTLEVTARTYAFDFAKEYPTVDGEGNAVSYQLVVEDAYGTDISEYQLSQNLIAEGQYELTLDYKPAMFEVNTKIYNNIHNETHEPDKVAIQIYYATEANATEEQWKVFPTMQGKVLDVPYTKDTKTYDVSYPVWQNISGTEDNDLYGEHYYYKYKIVKYTYVDAETAEETYVYPEDADYFEEFAYCWDENYTDDTYTTGAQSPVFYDAAKKQATGLMTGTLSDVVYQVTYHSNFKTDDGECSTPSQLAGENLKLYHETYQIRTEIPSSEKYKFVGWNTKADGSGIAYWGNGENSPEGMRTYYDTDANLDLYAQWAPSENTINDAIDKLNQLREDMIKEIEEMEHLTLEEKNNAKKEIEDIIDEAKNNAKNSESATDLDEIIEDIKGTDNEDGTQQEIIDEYKDKNLQNYKDEQIKELENQIAAEKKEIDARKDITWEEKNNLKEQLDEQLKNGKENIEDAKDLDEVDYAKVETEEVYKEVLYENAPNDPEKKKELAEEVAEKQAEKAKQEIDKRTDLTEEQKNEEKEKIDDELEKVKTELNNVDNSDEDWEEQIKDALSGLSDIIETNKKNEQNALFEKAKDDAKKRIEEEAQKNIQAINENEDLTIEQKTNAINEINQKVNDIKTQIDTAKDIQEITKKESAADVEFAQIIYDSIPTDAPSSVDAKQELDNAKEKLDDIVNKEISDIKGAAQEELQKELQNLIEEIQQSQFLSEDEKETAINQMKETIDEKIEQINRVDVTSSDWKAQLTSTLTSGQDAMQEFKTEAENKIINNGKDNTKEELAQIAEQAKTDVDTMKGLTEVQKYQKKQEIDTILQEILSQVDDLDSENALLKLTEDMKTQIETAQETNQKDDFSGLKDVAKEVLIKNAEVKKSEIDNMDYLSEQEKKLAKDQINTALQESLKQVEKANSKEQLEAAQKAGSSDLRDVLFEYENSDLDNTIQLIDKTINETLEKQKSLIESLENLSAQEKQEEIQKVEKAAEEAKQQVTALNSNSLIYRDQLDVIQSTMNDKMEASVKLAQVQNINNKITNTVQNINTDVEDKKAAIDDLPNLTVEQKEQLTNQLQEAANKLIENVKRVQSVDELAIEKAQFDYECIKVLFDGAKESDDIEQIEKYATKLIETKKQEEIEKINASDQLTEQEKASYIQQLESEMQDTKNMIAMEPVDEDWITHLEEYIYQFDAISDSVEVQVMEVTKQKTIEELQKQFEEYKNIISALNNLSISEKQQKIDEIERRFNEQKNSIMNAQNTAEVVCFRMETKETMATIQQSAKELDITNGRDSAIVELEKIAQQLIDKINQMDQLTLEEKKQAINKIMQCLQEAKEEVMLSIRNNTRLLLIANSQSLFAQEQYKWLSLNEGRVETVAQTSQQTKTKNIKNHIEQESIEADKPMDTSLAKDMQNTKLQKAQSESITDNDAITGIDVAKTVLLLLEFVEFLVLAGALFVSYTGIRVGALTSVLRKKSTKSILVILMAVELIFIIILYL